MEIDHTDEKINTEALKFVKKKLIDDFVYLNHFSHELANTIVNVYYRFWSLTFETVSHKEGLFPKMKPRELNVRETIDNNFENLNKIMDDYELAGEIISILQYIDKRKDPIEYKYLTELALDCLKYNIKNAQYKTRSRRMIERKFSKNQLRETPNLIALLNSV